MKRLLLVVFVMVSLYGISQAQCPGCVVNTLCTSNPAAPTICPDTMPDGIALQAYSADLSFYLPEQFVDAGTGFNVTLNELHINNVLGLPYGLSWETNAPNNIYYPSSNPPATEHGCARICGMPLVAGNYMITVFVTAHVKVAGINQTSDDSFQIPFTILPASSGNGSFSMTNPFGCAPLTTSFTSNYPSNGNQGYSYAWDFGNGLQSSSENPPSQQYITPGAYPVNLITTIDTAEYYMNTVEVLAASCADVGFAPDLYVKIKQGTSTIYTSPHLQNSNPPATITFPDVILGNTTYTLEIWDNDDFIGGGQPGDDLCGSVTFNGHTAGTHNLQDGSLVVRFDIEHPVIQIDQTDTVHVYPVPSIISILPYPNDSSCLNDSIQLVSVTNGAHSFQWHMDTVTLNATDSVILAGQTGNYFLEVMNTYGCKTVSSVQELTFINNPPKPTFYMSSQNELTTNSSASQLQWYLDGNPIPGATGQVLNITQSGDYHIIASNFFGCYTSSDTVYSTFDNSSIAEANALKDIKIYPNPGNGQFTLEFESSEFQDLRIRVFDVVGKQLFEQSLNVFPGAVTESLNLTFLHSGMYFLNIQGDDFRENHRLVIEK